MCRQNTKKRCVRTIPRIFKSTSPRIHIIRLLIPNTFNHHMPIVTPVWSSGRLARDVRGVRHVAWRGVVDFQIRGGGTRSRRGVGDVAYFWVGCGKRGGRGGEGQSCSQRKKYASQEFEEHLLAAEAKKQTNTYGRVGDASPSWRHTCRKWSWLSRWLEAVGGSSGKASVRLRRRRGEITEGV